MLLELFILVRFLLHITKKVNVGYTIGDIYFIMILVSEVIYRYKELIKNGIYNNDKKIKEALVLQKLFKIECGLYSDKKTIG